MFTGTEHVSLRSPKIILGIKNMRWNSSKIMDLMWYSCCCRSIPIVALVMAEGMILKYLGLIAVRWPMNFILVSVYGSRIDVTLLSLQSSTQSILCWLFRNISFGFRIQKAEDTSWSLKHIFPSIHHLIIVIWKSSEFFSLCPQMPWEWHRIYISKHFWYMQK